MQRQFLRFHGKSAYKKCIYLGCMIWSFETVSQFIKIRLPEEKQKREIAKNERKYVHTVLTEHQLLQARYALPYFKPTNVGRLSVEIPISPDPTTSMTNIASAKAMIRTSRYYLLLHFMSFGDRKHHLCSLLVLS